MVEADSLLGLAWPSARVSPRGPWPEQGMGPCLPVPFLPRVSSGQTGLGANGHCPEGWELYFH